VAVLPCPLLAFVPLFVPLAVLRLARRQVLAAGEEALAPKEKPPDGAGNENVIPFKVVASAGLAVLAPKAEAGAAILLAKSIILAKSADVSLMPCVSQGRAGFVDGVLTVGVEVLTERYLRSEVKRRPADMYFGFSAYVGWLPNILPSTLQGGGVRAKMAGARPWSAWGVLWGVLCSFFQSRTVYGTTDRMRPRLPFKAHIDWT
jgi:hypothetical protein